MRQRISTPIAEFRAMLATALILGLVFALPITGASASVSRAPADSRAPVAIVGAGLSGLVVAYRLTQAGIPFILFEADERVGGRVRTEGRSTLGRFEVGAELINSDHSAIQALARELGVNLVWRIGPSLGQRKRFFVRGQLLSHSAFSQLVFASSREPLRRIAADIRWRQAEHPSARRFDGLTVDNYLAEVLRPSDTDLRSYLTTVAQTEIGRSSAQATVHYLLSGLSIDLENETLDFMPTSDEALVVEAGTQALTDQLAARIDPSALRLGHLISRVDRLNNGHIRLHVHSGVDSGQSIQQVEVSEVVLSVPISAVSLLETNGFRWPAQLRALMDRPNYADVTKVVLHFREPFWLRDHETGRFVSDRGMTAWDSSQRCSGCHGLLTLYLHEGDERQLSLSERVGQFVLDLVQAYPDARDSLIGVDQARWQFAYTVPNHGQSTHVEIERAAQSAIPGLRVVGEAVDAQFQGYMNGAVQTAERAAVGIARVYASSRRSAACSGFFVNSQLALAEHP